MATKARVRECALAISPVREAHKDEAPDPSPALKAGPGHADVPSGRQSGGGD